MRNCKANMQDSHYLMYIVSVIPASEARRESFRKDSGQAGMTEI